MPEKSPVLSVVVRKFRDEDRDAANEVQRRIEKALESQPGFIAVRHSKPMDSEDGAFATVASFATLEDLVTWEQSKTREQLVAELAQYVEGEVVKNRLGELDALVGMAHPAKKWKTVLVLTICVLAVGAVLDWIASIVSPEFPAGYARFVTLLILNIILNSYIFLPKSMKLLHKIESKFQNRG